MGRSDTRGMFGDCGIRKDRKGAQHVSPSPLLGVATPSSMEVNVMRGSRILIALLLWIVSVLMSSPAAAASSPSWQTEWEKAVEAAKKEGQVVVYLKAGYDEVFAAFQKKYPDIKIV